MSTRRRRRDEKPPVPPPPPRLPSVLSPLREETRALWGDGARARRGARALERAPGPTAAAAAAAAQEAAEPAASPAQLAVCGVFVTERGLGIGLDLAKSSFWPRLDQLVNLRRLTSSLGLAHGNKRVRM